MINPAIPHYMQRVLDEKLALDEKLTKLGLFFQEPKFGDLPDADAFLLQVQHHTMRLYSDILGQRIHNANLKELAKDVK